MTDGKWRQVQRRVARLSDQQVRDILGPHNADLRDEQMPAVRRRAATVEQIEMIQIQVNDYVCGNRMDRVDELAFDLFTFVELQRPAQEVTQALELSGGELPF
jgi:hypothetical protein